MTDAPRPGDPGFYSFKDEPEADPGPHAGGNGSGQQEPPAAGKLDLTHDGLALEMGRAWPDARYVALFGRWLFFTGARWENDEKLIHLTRARNFLRQKGERLVAWAQTMKDDKLVLAMEDVAKALRTAQMIAQVVGLARSNRDQAAGTAQWDADPGQLGTPERIKS